MILLAYVGNSYFKGKRKRWVPTFVGTTDWHLSYEREITSYLP